ncbi:MAG: signal peptidase II [Clostridia bacterium]|nr:signal peptidase II [Clostridia bacterium]
MYQIITLAVIALLTAADQIIKIAVEANLASGGKATLIPHILSLEYVRNYNGMFGLFEGKRNWLAVFTVIVIAAAVVLLMMKKIKPLFVSCCAVAIIAGGIGNLIDRIVRGYVIDYIATDFLKFPTYNFADCLITVGCFLFMGYEIYEIIRDMKKSGKEKQDA